MPQDDAMPPKATGYHEAEQYPLLPTQYEALARVHGGKNEPERRLLLAVLSDAIVTFQAGAGDRAARRRRFEEAARWIFSDDELWPYSFMNVCDALGIAPTPLRRALLNWSDRHRPESTVRAARRRLLAGKELGARAVG